MKSEEDVARAMYNLWPETAKILGLGRNQVHQGARTGEIPVVQIGRRWLVPKAALERMLRTSAQPTDTEEGR